jgi:hypothetical protein
MVRIIAELSVNTPTASSSDRYKYRYGYGTGGGSWGRQQFVYRRPAHDVGEKQSLAVNDNNENDRFNDCQSNIIHNHIDKINNTTIRVNTMIATHYGMRENYDNSDKENEALKKEEELKGAKVINAKLGKIIYRSRAGELFVAQHSVQMTIVFVFDKKTGQSTQTQTQKIVWNDEVFETKQVWFSEMARLSAERAELNMMIFRCE